MLFRISLLLLLSSVISGCQSTPKKKVIPDNVLNSLSTQWVIVEACYKSDAYTMEQAINYRDAINYSFSTWATTQSDIDRVVGQKRQEVNDFKTTNGGLGTTCKDWHLNFETTVRNTNNHKRQVSLNQQRSHEITKARASSSSSSSTNVKSMIQCTKLGDLSFNKNIQTFNGSICPIGWLPYSGW